MAARPSTKTSMLHGVCRPEVQVLMNGCVNTNIYMCIQKINLLEAMASNQIYKRVVFISLIKYLYLICNF